MNAANSLDAVSFNGLACIFVGGLTFMLNNHFCILIKAEFFPNQFNFNLLKFSFQEF